MNGTHQQSAVNQLREVSWMQELTAAIRDRVIADAYETTHERSDFVALNGDVVHSWMYVGEGLVKVIKFLSTGRVVRFPNVAKGGWIGEAAIATGALRQYDVVATEHTRIVHIPAETFRLLLQLSPEFNQFVIGQLSQRVYQFMSIVEADRLTNPIARLARVIADLHDPVLCSMPPAEIHLSQEELGELAGLTRQRTNLAVKTLEKSGAVHVHYRGVFVRDLAALRRIGEQDRENERAPQPKASSAVT
jgi:CRP-like cAMP-binding protein